MLDNGIVLISGENPRGTPAFKDLVSDPPTSEPEFVGLWKLYILTLIASVLVEYEVPGEDAKSLIAALVAEGLLPAKTVPLRNRVKLALDYVRRSLRGSSVEGGLALGESGLPELTGKITLSEPSSAQSARGLVSVDELLARANSAFQNTDLQVWLLFDRLDVAFAESRELEANGLRALFKTYLDLLSSDRINLKIFLRSDVWASITAQGFREASHITRQLTISWSNPALLDLVVNRLVRNDAVLRSMNVDANDVRSATQKRAIFDRIVPEKVDAGRNPQTFEWVLSRAQDGTRLAAPREVIHLLTEARNAQLALLERSEEPPPGDELLSRQALREAMPPVSQVRLEQTIYAEYPELRPAISALEEEKENIDTFKDALQSVPEKVADMIVESDSQGRRPLISRKIVQVAVEEAWAPIQEAIEGPLHLDEVVRSLRILAVLSCPAPDRHPAVRRSALRPLESDLLSAAVRARLEASFPQDVN